MPTLAQIKAELDNDPEALGYAALLSGDTPNDQGVADLLNARTYRGMVPIIDLSAYCTTQGITGGIEATANNQAADISVRGLCYSVLSVLRDDLRLNFADLDDPAFDTMTDLLVGVGLLTSQQQTALKALGENRRSRAAVLWSTATEYFPTITATQVGNARNEVA